MAVYCTYKIFFLWKRLNWCLITTDGNKCFSGISGHKLKPSAERGQFESEVSPFGSKARWLWLPDEETAERSMFKDFFTSIVQVIKHILYTRHIRTVPSRCLQHSQNKQCPSCTLNVTSKLCIFFFFCLQQKYFDSGDYNMAKAKMKNKQLPAAAGPDKNIVTGDHIPTPQDLPQRKSSLVTSKLAG